MIISNGKLFGKISIIDIGIVAVLVVALVILAPKFLPKAQNVATIGKSDEVTMVIQVNETPADVAAMVKNGQPVRDYVQNNYLGSISKFTIGDPVNYTSNIKGETVISGKPGYKSVTMTVTSNGNITESGFTTGGVSYAAGQTGLTIRAGATQMQALVLSISKKE